MKVTVVKPDNYISIDGKAFHDVDLSSLDANISAIQWYGDKGEIETVKEDTINEIENTRINSIEFLSSIIDKCLSEAEKEISLEETAQIVRSERDSKLFMSDWTQVADAPVDQATWAVYRQALRDLPEQLGFPATVVWPTEPK